MEVIVPQQHSPYTSQIVGRVLHLHLVEGVSQEAVARLFCNKFSVSW